MGTIHDDEKAKIDAFVRTLYAEDTPASHALRAVLAEGITLYVQQLPNGNWPPRFKPGERVEYVSHRPDREPNRPGIVVSIDLEPRVHHHLRVLFDDGEERQINKDVMRRIREDRDAPEVQADR